MGCTLSVCYSMHTVLQYSMCSGGTIQLNYLCSRYQCLVCCVGMQTPVPAKKEKGGKASVKESKVPPPPEDPPASPVVDTKQREILERMRKEELTALKKEGGWVGACSTGIVGVM